MQALNYEQMFRILICLHFLSMTKGKIENASLISSVKVFFLFLVGKKKKKKLTKHFINQNPLDSFLLQCFFSYKNKINLRLDVQMCVTRHHYNGFFMGHCTEKHTSIWDFFHRIRLIMRFHCKFEWTDILLRGKKNKTLV